MPRYVLQKRQRQADSSNDRQKRSARGATGVGQVTNEAGEVAALARRVSNRQAEGYSTTTNHVTIRAVVMYLRQSAQRLSLRRRVKRSAIQQ